MIIGQYGSGKTAIFNSILNEMIINVIKINEKKKL